MPPAPETGAGDDRPAWSTWLILGGRGAGKTRTGAEWIRSIAASGQTSRLALVGETFGDVRDVMIDGVSGLLAIHRRADRPLWEAGRRRLVWPNGVVAQAFSAEEPDSLRGPQFGAAWCDELAKWRHADAAWDNLQFALRLGTHPRVVATTTPRPTALLKRLAGERTTALTHAPTALNAFNLSPEFIRRVTDRYGGTRLGRQELDGEFVDERADAFWNRAQLDGLRIAPQPPENLQRIVVAIDPPAGAGARVSSIKAAPSRSALEPLAVAIRHAARRLAPPLRSATFSPPSSPRI